VHACASDRGGLGWQCVRLSLGQEDGWEGSARVQVTVLHPVVSEADGGAACGGQS
jgi:hypothetical protein